MAWVRTGYRGANVNVLPMPFQRSPGITARYCDRDLSIFLPAQGSLQFASDRDLIGDPYHPVIALPGSAPSRGVFGGWRCFRNIYFISPASRDMDRLRANPKEARKMKMCPFLKEQCIGNECNLYDLKQDKCIYWVMLHQLEKISGGPLKR